MLAHPGGPAVQASTASIRQPRRFRAHRPRGINFTAPVHTLSTLKFINLSIQVVNNADFPGLPERDGIGLVLWGSGGYRRSNVYLAHVNLDRIEDHTAIRYYAGLTDVGLPKWSGIEAEAAPLFLSGSVGEVCVRWNPFLRRFILLYNSDNPRCVLEHQSSTPWGPWADHQVVFDQVTALGKYIHQAGSEDGLSDKGKEEVGGDAYGPYLIAPYTTPNPDGTTTMYFVLSVWNPYNTMLMKATIGART